MNQGGLCLGDVYGMGFSAWACTLAGSVHEYIGLVGGQIAWEGHRPKISLLSID